MGGLQKIQEIIYKSHAYLFWPPFKNYFKFPILIKVKCCQVNTPSRETVCPRMFILKPRLPFLVP